MKAIAVESFRMVEILTLRAECRGESHLDPRPCRDPAKRGRVEEPSAFDHRTAGFGERRHAELQPARERAAVPRRRGTAVVLLPDAEPRKVGALPRTAEDQLMRRRKRRERRDVVRGI